MLFIGFQSYGSYQTVLFSEAEPYLDVFLCVKSKLAFYKYVEAWKARNNFLYKTTS